MSIIDTIMKSTAQRYRTRMIMDRAEAKRLGCAFGDQIREPMPRAGLKTEAFTDDDYVGELSGEDRYEIR